VLLGAVELQSVLQIQETGAGVRVTGVATAGPFTRCALRCRLFGGGGGRQLAVRNGRVEYTLTLPAPARTGARGWLAARLRRATESESSGLPGEDWSLLPRLLPPPPSVGVAAAGGTAAGSRPSGKADPRCCGAADARRGSGGSGGSFVSAEGDEGEDAAAREALAALEVYISGFEVRGRDTRDEHTVYAILCRARPPAAPAPVAAGASEGGSDAARTAGDVTGRRSGQRGGAAAAAAVGGAPAVGVRRVAGPSWTVYRRFREFVALKKELSTLAAAATAAGAADGDDGDDGRPSRGAAGRRRRASAVALPALPRRRFFGSMSPAVLRERVWGLDAFLTQLTLLAGGAGGAACPGLASAVARFLMLAPPPPGPCV
jgi:hypothetical protein